MDAPQPAADKPKQVIRETDAEAIRLARTLIATNRYGALAVINHETGFPGASRVALATDYDGTPLVLVSALSGHTKPMLDDPRSSLLVGEAGKGDPLAHPRITLFTRARRLDRETDEGKRARRRYLARQPKAALYADFGDFAFFRLEIERASLNGGFGKAYELTAEDLAPLGDTTGVAAIEESAAAHMNEDHAEAIALYAEVFGKAGAGKWRLATLDTEGMDLVDGDRTSRVWFPAPLMDAGELRRALVDLAREARATAAQTD
ncbi:HugZ family protein [Oricola sp.]|uniref:HugZ family pyridoxamine 5'-phosphate oxidase n=1 Tax=Oricola sp. TaxID=1979950 RepID=UPI0025EDEC71|nr:HugZ family protein [Oricola sp.]MCI5074428.1 HugZ family protein [Oricola sp.]